MPGLIGKKIGMTSIFDGDGKNFPCTVIELGPCVVTQLKSNDVDGYEAVQIGFGEKTPYRLPPVMLQRPTPQQSQSMLNFVILGPPCP